MKQLASVVLLLLSSPGAFGGTCLDGTTCNTDADCGYCSKSTGQPCTNNVQCELGNGDRCSKTRSGACQTSTTSTTTGSDGGGGGSGGGGGGTGDGVCTFNGEIACAADADCKFCTKTPGFGLCGSDSDCIDGNGDKCRAQGLCATPEPTSNPSRAPTGSPTSPTNSPTPNPTDAPTPSPTPPPTDSPTPPPTNSPDGDVCPNGPATYFPGNLVTTITAGGLVSSTNTLLASAGLAGRILTKEGQAVAQSGVIMHSNADGAATVPDDSNSARYYLVSNSESSSGGVGILHFDATTTPHDVIGYRRTAENTSTGSRNCGGGRTPWGTWLTSEESGDGHVWEVDPNASEEDIASETDFCDTPIVPSEGGNYESNAFWEAPDNKYHFYTTEDANYRLTRFVPNDDKATMLAEPRKLNRLCGANGQLGYLKLVCDAGCSSLTPSGSYSWDERVNSWSWESGDFEYPAAEGIDVKGNELYFVTKGQRRLYVVDLSSNTWTSTPTIQDDGGVTFSPDQIARITGSDSPDDLIYFAEDGGSDSQDIHARGLDDTGTYRTFTIIRGYSTETTGLTFSPDNKYMYFSAQSASEIWQIWREDGCTFGNGVYLNVNYHSGVRRHLRR